MLLLSLAPLAVFVVLIIWKNTKLVWVALTSLLITLFLITTLWRMNISLISASFIKGVLISSDIFLIVFGALFFLATLNASNTINKITVFIEMISPDYRIQIILLAWFFESFLEGTAGFGTPPAVIAPILISLGLSPLTAVAVTLLGNSGPGIFGAAGAPTRIGFAGLETFGIPTTAAFINLVSFIVPVFMLAMVSLKQKNGWTHFKEGLSFAIFSGFALLVPSFYASFLGEEFPTIIGSVVGLLLVLLNIKLKLFVPKTIRTLSKATRLKSARPPLRVFTPYVLLISLLLIAKFSLGEFGISLDFGIKHKLSLFSPGIVFIITSLILIHFNHENKKKVLSTLKESFFKSIEPFFVIVFISVMVQLMIYSGQNSSGLQSLLKYIADGLRTQMLPFLTPFLGAFGSFLTGSVTVSNIMFGGLLQNISQSTGQNSNTILSLQLVGGAVGNMIALADIMPALAVVGRKGSEREIIRRVIIPCLIVIFMIGLFGLVLVKQSWW